MMKRPFYKGPARRPVSHPDAVVVTKPKIYLRDRLYIPKHLFNREVAKTFSVILENYYPEYDESGEPIDNRDLLIKGYRDEGKYISIARGDLDKVWDYFGSKAEIVDMRSTNPLSFELKWLGVKLEDGTRGALKPEQEKFISEMMGLGYGIGEAPPRFGKTICMSNIVCRAKMKTLVIVHQIELAMQFESEFRRCTNVNSMEHVCRRRLVGICKSFEDFEKFDICITTWQRFHAPLPNAEADERIRDIQSRKNKRAAEALRKVRDRFGLVLVDETHRAASACFSAVVGKFNPWYRFGVTATPDRKDRLDAVIKLIVGPVVASADEKKILLRVRPVYTGFTPKFTQWHAYESQIMRDGPRNKLALDMIIKDVKLGHSVIVVCTRTKHIQELTRALLSRGISAEAFWSGQKDRKGLLERAKKGQTKVTVAYRGMLLGINVPRWSSMHVLSPSNNAPNFTQEISRVRTAMEGKTYAVIRDYIDNHSAANGCYRTRHRVYTDAKRQPVVFEDEFGTVVKSISLSYIKERASIPRSAIKGQKSKSLSEMEPKFGNGGPKSMINHFDEAPLGAKKQVPVSVAGWGSFGNDTQLTKKQEDILNALSKPSSFGAQVKRPKLQPGASLFGAATKQPLQQAENASFGFKPKAPVLSTSPKFGNGGPRAPKSGWSSFGSNN
jgi:superfamily II DNA or RNA helicase